LPIVPILAAPAEQKDEGGRMKDENDVVFLFILHPSAFILSLSSAIILFFTQTTQPAQFQFT
jgi:hypothetical protein